MEKAEEKCVGKEYFRRKGRCSLDGRPYNIVITCRCVIMFAYRYHSVTARQFYSALLRVSRPLQPLPPPRRTTPIPAQPNPPYLHREYILVRDLADEVHLAKGPLAQDAQQLKVGHRHLGVAVFAITARLHVALDLEEIIEVHGAWPQGE